MRPPVGIDQVVGYVAPPAQRGGSTSIKKAVVLEAFDDGTARLDTTARTEDGSAAANRGEALGHHIALAAYNEDKKTENTFHLLNETARPALAPVRPAPSA